MAHYYDTSLSEFPSNSHSKYHLGRLGGNWRHIKQTNNYTNHNLLFVDGSVKIEDEGKLPPLNRRVCDPVKSAPFASQSLSNFYTQSESNFAAKQAIVKSNGTRFSQHAKQNFVYWPKDPKETKRKAQSSKVYTTGAYKTFFGLSDSSLKL